MKINIQTRQGTPRFKYAAEFLLGQILGFKLSFGKEEAIGVAEDEMLILHYGTQRPVNAKLFIPAHPFLQRKDLEPPEIAIQKEDDLVFFFHLPAIENTDLPFDLFAMTFYLLSRFEEYDSKVVRDKHNRFPAKASLAAKEGFLNQPLIDQWAWRFYDVLKKQFPNCPERKPSYSFSPTIDVDFAWAYLHKGWERSSASFLKSLLKLEWRQLKRQLKVKKKQEKDPYDTFAFLEKIHEKHKQSLKFFMLLGDYGTFDKNNRPDHPAMQQLMKNIAKKATLGIHPSYNSNKGYRIFETEKQRLEKTLGGPVRISRQHFLKLEFPKTYQWLEKAGIDEDYSMGYAAATGFRASTAHSFFWYDLEREKLTNLKVVPFSVMDVTLKNYLGLNPEAAVDACAKIIEQTRKTGGTFCLLWHNSSFSFEMGWEEWGGIYEKIVALAS